MSEYTTALTTFIKEEILHGRARNLSVDEDLLTAGILDSLGMLRLVGFVESQFGLKVPDEDVVFENFNSISALSRYLENARDRAAKPAFPG